MSYDDDSARPRAAVAPEQLRREAASNALDLIELCADDLTREGPPDAELHEQLARAAWKLARLALLSALAHGRRADCLRVASYAAWGALRNVVWERTGREPNEHGE